MGDVNLEVAGVLLDMAALAGDSQRGWGYRRAAKAVLRLDRHITQERIINYWSEAKFLKWARGAWDR